MFWKVRYDRMRLMSKQCTLAYYTANACHSYFQAPNSGAISFLLADGTWVAVTDLHTGPIGPTHIAAVHATSRCINAPRTLGTLVLFDRPSLQPVSQCEH